MPVPDELTSAGKHDRKKPAALVWTKPTEPQTKSWLVGAYQVGGVSLTKWIGIHAHSHGHTKTNVTLHQSL